MIQIDMEMPKSCNECPLTYLDTCDDAYFGANERRCVIDGSCIDEIVSERAYDCPLVEAIPKANYEAKLKADMVAILTEIQLEIEEVKTQSGFDESWDGAVKECSKIIQQKINALKGEVMQAPDMSDGMADLMLYKFKKYLGSVSREIQNRRLKNQD